MRFSEEYYADQMKGINGSVIRDIFKLLGDPGMISFAGGNPSNNALEPEVVRCLVCEAIDRYGTNALQYGGTEGLPGLRKGIADYLSSTAGVRCTADNILPVQGSSQAFDLLLKALINPGDVILVESPTFLGAIQAMRIYKAQLVAMPMDEGGVIIEEVEKLVQKHHPKMMYIIPTFQNPTGRTLLLERRKALAEMAAKYGFVIAEDDPYRDLRYTGEALPSISSFDEEGWVVYMSSFSKYIAPGLRVGAAAVPHAGLLRKMVIGKQSSDVHSPILTQAIVELYLEKGLLPGHLDRICGEYRAQMEAMLEGFACFPEGTKHTVPQGGLFVWAELPEGMNATDALNRAVAQNVAFVPGTHFYPEGGHENTLRLNFSMQTLERIREGMERLGKAIKG
ncbi:MAG: PLP-dependent aminotransferase family protein [Eubacteriales bacterium]|nr:PLP-dependent aminotransferase family protein [Eubacteriales bacterium]